MNEYKVIWEVTLMADSPFDAAIEAENIQNCQLFNSDCERGVFDVIDLDTQDKKITRIDLGDEITK